MKILFVCPYPPYPVISGGHTRVFNILKELSAKHEISLIAYNREAVTEEQRAILKKYCTRLRFIQRGPVWSFRNMGRYLFSKDPFMHVINGRDGRVTEAVEEELGTFKPEILHVEHFHMAQAVLQAESARLLPKVISEQGVEYLILERMSAVSRNPVKKLAAALEAARIKPFEISICNRFDACVEVSQTDSEIIRQAGVKIPVKVAVNGVDVNYFAPGENKKQENALVFVGTFKFFGNVDAIKWLLKRVWPKIKQNCPGLRFYIVGNRPPKWLKRYDDPDIVVTGWVPDVREYIDKSRLVVAPLRMGSGTKLKILEAMAMGKPVVTTSVGAEGIGALAGFHMVIQDDPIKFGEAVNQLLQDPRKSEEMGGNARKFILDNYSWKKAAEQMSIVYQGLANQMEKV